MLTIPDGGFLKKTAHEHVVYDFDWDDYLPATASIQTSVMTAEALRPSAAAALTLDNTTNAARTTQVRVLAGTKGAYYKIINQITTDESPDQILEAWCFLAVI